MSDKQSGPNGHPFIFTSESVTEGHPDKVCDFISDTVLDAHLRRTERPRGLRGAMQAGRAPGGRDHLCARRLRAVVREAIRDIGYADPATASTPTACR